MTISIYQMWLFQISCFNCQLKILLFSSIYDNKISKTLYLRVCLAILFSAKYVKKLSLEQTSWQTFA